MPTKQQLAHIIIPPIVCFFYIYFLMQLIPLFSQSLVLIIIFSFLYFFYSVASYTIFHTKPGFITYHDIKDQITVQKLQEYKKNELRKEQILIIIKNVKTYQQYQQLSKQYIQLYTEYSLCPVCELLKIPRSHHCYVCNGCVLRKQKHSNIINKCIGENNLKQYIRYILFSFILLGFMLLSQTIIVVSFRFRIKYLSFEVIGLIIWFLFVGVCLIWFYSQIIQRIRNAQSNITLVEKQLGLLKGNYKQMKIKIILLREKIIIRKCFHLVTILQRQMKVQIPQHGYNCINKIDHNHNQNNLMTRNRRNQQILNNIRYQLNHIMARGPKKHMKRINTPKSWLLSKMGGIYATRPSQGPHKRRDCLPLSVVIRSRLKLALTGREAQIVVMDKEGGFKIDGKIRRDTKFPVGVMDVVSVVKTGENYRMLYDVKGRFVLNKIKDTEAKFKLLKIKSKAVGPNKIPYIVTSDGRTIRFPHPQINIGDTIKYDLQKGQIQSWIKHQPGNLCFIIGGNNVGRVGQLMHVQRHLGSIDIAHVKDATGKTFATRQSNIFMIGEKKSLISIPEGDGIYLNILESKQAKEEARRKTSAK